MRILLWGMNHRSAPLAVREAFAVAEVGPALEKLCAAPESDEAVICSTWNRTRGASQVRGPGRWRTQRFATLEAEALQKFGSLRHADMLARFGECEAEGLAKLAQLDRSVLVRFGGWDAKTIKNISRLEPADIQIIAELRIAPGQAVENALSGFRAEQIRMGPEVFQLDRKGMTHILERHHPQYCDGSVNVPQSFLDPHMTVSDIKAAVRSIMQQNRDYVIRQGTNARFQITGSYGGRTYRVGFMDGRVGQFYPL